MSALKRLTAKKALLGIAALVVVGGILVGLGSSFASGQFGSMAARPSGSLSAGANQVNALQGVINGPPGFNGASAGDTQVIGQVTTIASITSEFVVPNGAQPHNPVGFNVSQGSPMGAGGLIEFSSDLTIRSSSPQQTASGVVALAYSVGGYVAYQTTYSSSANIVVRVPASQYEQVLTRIEAMGTVIVLTSNSNDVRVQYTDLNATLSSLRTEQNALLRLLNQSTSINSTLAIESQLQGVNKQINDIESQILQTRTLIHYATINVTVTQTAQQAPLSMTVSVTPKDGTTPLSVTFNAIVKGGSQPYVVNYNFGDGSASQGQIVIHTYYQAGSYKVTVSATDQNGTVVQSPTTVMVVAAQQTQIQDFLGTVSGLFVSVVEGIVEVAVVVLPIAAVGAIIIIPIQRHNRAQKSVKESGV